MGKYKDVYINNHNRVKYVDVAMTDDSVIMDRHLYTQLLDMLEALSDIQGRTALNERHISELNNDISLLRRSLNL